MALFIVLRDYVCWHYSRAFSDIFHIWSNITHFVFHFFSIPLLLRTFFAPWKRIEATRETQGLNISDYISTKLVNTIMRLIGASMRAVLIFIGLVVVATVVIAGMIFFVLWVLLPIIVLIFAGAGIQVMIFG
ncbi:MAG: hypothetical protein KAS07_01095 [Candidatus Pacebacteria bacterium]|nr:hypothetical protein [Candidatus Paceibacterota bacterium]